jgi:four helix bundle protein
MNPRELEQRTREFAVRCLKVVDALPSKPSARAVAGQLARSGTSIGANYRAANRGRSRAEWLAKLSIVIEECDETVYWLEIIIESAMLKPALIEPLRQEAGELLAIFARSRHTARNNNREGAANRPITKSPDHKIP